MIQSKWLEEECLPEYKKEFRQLHPELALCTTRFNNDTYLQNKIAKRKLKKGCLYCNIRSITNLREDVYIFVLELNNSENKIVGVGLIPHILYDVTYRIYEDDLYNQPYFAGKYHIARENLTNEEETLFQSLDRCCFYGRKHLKRGSWMTKFPIDILALCLQHDLDIIDKICIMFLARFPIRL